MKKQRNIIEWHQKKGHTTALYRLGMMHLNGTAVTPDVQGGVQMIIKAAEQKEENAVIEYAELLKEGEIIEKR